MSNPARKISFHTISVNREETQIDPGVLKDVLSYINELPQEQRVYNIASSRKVHFMKEQSTYQNRFRNIVMVSGKYHHRPDLINVNTAESRENPKTLTEAEEERTHISLDFSNSEIRVVMEDRRSGISISYLVNYIERYARLFHKETKTSKDYTLDYTVIPKENFLEELNKLSRVACGYIYADKKILGSEYLNYSKRTAEVKDELIINVIAKRGRSILDTIIDSYHKFIVPEENIKRVRIRGINDNGRQILLDTDIIKRIEYIEVHLNDEKGIVVDSDEIFNQFAKLLGGLDEDEEGSKP